MMQWITAQLTKARMRAATAQRRTRVARRQLRRKAARLRSQPEAKMLRIAGSGVGLITAELFLIGLSTDAVSGELWPHTFVASGLTALAWGFYAALGLKREADALPSLWKRIEAA